MRYVQITKISLNCKLKRISYRQNTMGNEESQNSSEALRQLRKYQQISKTDDGTIYRLKNFDSQNNEQGFKYFLLKQHNYHHEAAYETAFKRYKEQIKNNKSEQSQSNTLSVQQAVKEHVQHFCSNTYKIFTLYEYPQLTLNDEIQVRAKQGKYFEECQLIAILQTCIMALEQIKSIICFSSKCIFISSQGVIKVLHSDLVDQNYRHLITENTYYAPEKLTNFMSDTASEIGLKKQIIFSIGMTLLEACCLQELHHVYDYNSQQIKGSKLETIISAIGSRYSPDLIDLISNMLQINPNRRISVLQIQRSINRYEDAEKSNLNQQAEDLQIQNTEREELEQKCDQFFYKEDTTLPKIKESIESTEQPSVPNLLSNQSSSRISMNKNHDLPKNYDLVKNHGLSKDSDKNLYKQSHNSKQYDSFAKNETANFTVPTNRNQTLFTDPKLLEMIRKDLEEISKSRTYRLNSNDSVHHSWINNSTENNQTNRFGDFKINRQERSNSHSSNTSKNAEQFTNFNDCPQVQSLAVSVAMQSSGKKFYTYEQSQVKNQPQSNMRSSIALSSKNFQPQTKIFGESDPNTARYPLKQMSTNHFSNQNFSEIQEQIKKDMMKKKQANLVYLQQIYEDGVKYEGMSKDSLKQGYGKLIYNDGAYYEGYFHNDKINGKGTLYYQKNHPAYDGEWVEQQFNGYGELYNEEPEQLQEQFPFHNFNFLENYWVKYEGDFQQDNKHGQGKMILTTDQYIEGQFKDDMLNGWARFYKSNGDFIEGKWENNILVELRNQ